MKRIGAILLTLLLLFSLTACIEVEDPDNIRGQLSSSTTTAKTSSAAGEDEDEFSLGETSGLTYENSFIGIGCTLDNGWTFYNDEQIMELNNATADMAGEEYEEILKNATVIRDMYAVNENQLDVINVSLEKVNLLQWALLDPAENLELLIPTIEAAFENMGFINITHELGTVTIDGQEFAGMSCRAEINGIPMYQVSFSFKCKGYLVSVSITSYSEDTTGALLDAFYLL